jgi:hypothetical protein
VHAFPILGGHFDWIHFGFLSFHVAFSFSIVIQKYIKTFCYGLPGENKKGRWSAAVFPSGLPHVPDPYFFEYRVK